ncbi:MAG: class I SAM-dependent methyltransferase [Armatimonadetes bacterium]|nr:class I SAM-dependent methyltransferase [Armatimonadota bacterium]
MIENYYLSPRDDILELFPPLVDLVLDIGCGGGILGKTLKERGVKEIIGIEFNEQAVEHAKNFLDKVYQADLEEFEPPFKERYFDCIICSDILEHLKDPWNFLKKYSKFLKLNGYLLTSIPNIRYYFTIYSLLKGNWDYTSRGIFDYGHLRFFTLKSIKKLLKEANFKIVRLKRNYRLREPYCLHQNLAKLLSLYVFKDFFTFQYVILAKKL